MAHYALALDVGGTFTDVMLMHRESGQLWIVKTPSTPADASEGFFQGIQKILSLAGVAPAAVGHVLHGSTVATNTIPAAAAPAFMADHHEVGGSPEIGDIDIPARQSVRLGETAAPGAAAAYPEVRERVLLDGTVHVPLDQAGCREMAQRLRAMGVEAVAIVFLYAYANAAHEQRAAAIVQDEILQVQVSLSSDAAQCSASTSEPWRRC